MRNISYVIRLPDKLNSYAYGLGFKHAKVFPTREAAREDKRIIGGGRIEKIFQVELSKNGKAKRIIKEVR